MAFPPDCIGPVCDTFLQRTKKLLKALETDPRLLPATRYGVLTLKLLVEKNVDALLYISTAIVQQQDSFLNDAFKFMLCGVPEEDGASEIVTMLCEFIGTIFRCNSVVTNDGTLKELLSSLYMLSTTDVTKRKMVPPSVLHLAITALCQRSSEWSMQQEHTQQKALVILKWLLQHLSMQPSSRLLAKALLIQLLLLAGQALDDVVILDFEEADFILTALSHSTMDPHCPCSVGEAMQLLKYLIEYAPNKLILTDRNILDPLANLVDSEQGKDQECAAELISTLLIDPPSASDEVKTKTCQMAMLPEMTRVNPSPTSTTYPADPDKDKVCRSPDYGATDVMETLLPCALSCFESFMAACQQHSETDASLQLMYTSTLMRLMLDVFSQHDEDVQVTVANSIAALPGVAKSLVTMLWGSSVVIPLDYTQFPSVSWITTFFDIQNCLILWTDRSELFCQALTKAGLLHFVESELDRIGEADLNSAEVETTLLHNALEAQTHSVLSILYNCVQKPKCLPVIISKIRVDNSLPTLASSPNLEARFLSKLILGFLLPALTTEQRQYLKLMPDEIRYALSTLDCASQSPDLTADGYSASELLQGLLNFVEYEENHPIFIDAEMLGVLETLLQQPNECLQKLSLQLAWSILSATDSHAGDIFLSSADLMTTIKNMRVFPQFKCLHRCVLFLLQQQGDSDVSELLMYARGCFQYQKYQECITSTSQIIQLVREKKGIVRVEQAIADEANLLKGKSLYYAYQSEQQVFVETRSSLSVKTAEKLKQQCYRKAREAIILLGRAHDYGFLDEEGSELLDCAMIDYVRETNSLNDCERCLLCRRKSELRRSHVLPNSILKQIAKDFVVEGDHKVFIPLIGKAVKKSAGECTFWMFCPTCEERLCQNGEEQFAKRIHSKVCPDRKVIQSELTFQYGSWLYDFCVGIFFRTLTISKTTKCLYKLFTECRMHLLSLPVKVPAHKTGKRKPKQETATAESTETIPSPLVSPESKLSISLFMNPTVNVPPHKRKLSYFNYILKAPGLFLSPITLDSGIYSYDEDDSFFLAHFDCLNILIQFHPSACVIPALCEIKPLGGELVIPEEHRRWQVIPTGVWQLFSAHAQAIENGSAKHQKSTDSIGFVYNPLVIISLNESDIVSCLPPSYSLSVKDSCEVAIQFPQDHRVIMRTTRQWGQKQKVTYLVVEDSHQRPYLVFILSLPSFLHLVDGALLDTCNHTVVLPFLDRKTDQNHPLKLAVLRALVNDVPEIEACLHTRNQLS